MLRQKRKRRPRPYEGYLRRLFDRATYEAQNHQLFGGPLGLKEVLEFFSQTTIAQIRKAPKRTKNGARATQDRLYRYFNLEHLPSLALYTQISNFLELYFESPVEWCAYLRGRSEIARQLDEQLKKRVREGLDLKLLLRYQHDSLASQVFLASCRKNSPSRLNRAMLKSVEQALEKHGYYVEPSSLRSQDYQKEGVTNE